MIEDLFRWTADLFDNEDAAMEILRQHFDELGTPRSSEDVDLSTYYMLALEARQKRDAAGYTSHHSILENDLKLEVKRSKVPFAMRLLPVTLQTIESQRDPGMKQAWFSLSVSRKTPRCR